MTEYMSRVEMGGAEGGASASEAKEADVHSEGEEAEFIMTVTMAAEAWEQVLGVV